MYIVDLTYLEPMAKVEEYLAEHIRFLDKWYAAGKFICSGRKNPRTGGVILCRAKDRGELDGILTEDPFWKQKIAHYTITEFIPSKYATDFEVFLLEK